MSARLIVGNSAKSVRSRLLARTPSATYLPKHDSLCVCVCVFCIGVCKCLCVSNCTCQITLHQAGQGS